MDRQLPRLSPPPRTSFQNEGKPEPLRNCRLARTTGHDFSRGRGEPGGCDAMMALEWGCIRRIVLIFCGFVLGVTSCGCAFGPRVLEKTHGLYQESIRQVDEEQLLRNIVHLRYSELPLELNVSSITTQYELAGAVEARPFFMAPPPAIRGIFRTFTSILPDVSVSGANRPTITLVPGDTRETIQRFLTPIP